MSRDGCRMVVEDEVREGLNVNKTAGDAKIEDGMGENTHVDCFLGLTHTMGFRL